jgi:hypothetical protein
MQMRARTDSALYRFAWSRVVVALRIVERSVHSRNECARTLLSAMQNSGDEVQFASPLSLLTF